jgi:hypothetical protein
MDHFTNIDKDTMQMLFFYSLPSIYGMFGSCLRACLFQLIDYIIWMWIFGNLVVCGGRLESVTSLEVFACLEFVIFGS